MYAVIKDGTVVCTMDSMPSVDDLATRGELGIQCDSTAAPGYTYDGTKFSPPTITAPTTESLLASIRIRRDSLLSKSDVWMLGDYPCGEFTREQWTAKVLVYRQALRDFPATCSSLSNPTYPIL